jgi:ABC-type multidrug transport system ATPase subunit
MSVIYSLMGVCPQDNLLWDALTGREHLQFYGRLKNLTVRQPFFPLALSSGSKQVKNFQHRNEIYKMSSLPLQCPLLRQ